MGRASPGLPISVKSEEDLHLRCAFPQFTSERPMSVTTRMGVNSESSINPSIAYGDCVSVEPTFDSGPTFGPR